MKSLKVLFLGLSLFWTAFAEAQGSRGEFGLGFVLGDPTGISGRYSLSSENYLSGAIGSASGFKHSHISLDYLWMNRRSFQTDFEPLNLYWGLGGRIQTFKNDKKNNETGLGVRFPLGVVMTLNEPSSEVFAEVAPVLNVAPKIDVDFDIGIGFRVRF